MTEQFGSGRENSVRSDGKIELSEASSYQEPLRTRGSIDVVSGTLIAGWICSNSPDSELELRVYLNNLLLGSTKPMFVRRDVSIIPECANVSMAGYELQSFRRLPAGLYSARIEAFRKSKPSDRASMQGGQFHVPGDPICRVDGATTTSVVVACINQPEVTRWFVAIDEELINECRDVDRNQTCYQYSKRLGVSTHTELFTVVHLPEATCSNIQIRLRSKSQAITTWISVRGCTKKKRLIRRYLEFLPTEGFTNQRLAIVAAAAIAHIGEFTLVLPSSLYSRVDMSVTDPTKGNVVAFPISELYDIELLIRKLNHIVPVVKTLPPSGLQRFHISLDRHGDLQELKHRLSQFNDRNNFVLNVGPTFQRLVAEDCSMQTLLNNINDALVFVPKVYEYTSQILANMTQQGHPMFNAIHLRNEPDARAVWGHLQQSNSKLSSILHRKGVLQNFALYAACGRGCNTDELSFDAVFTKETFFKDIYQANGWLQDGIVAAIDFEIVKRAKTFAGVLESAFSHAVFAAREKASKSNIVLWTKDESPNFMWGDTVPHPKCTEGSLAESVARRRSMYVGDHFVYFYQRLRLDTTKDGKEKQDFDVRQLVQEALRVGNDLGEWMASQMLMNAALEQQSTYYSGEMMQLMNTLIGFHRKLEASCPEPLADYIIHQLSSGQMPFHSRLLLMQIMNSADKLPVPAVFCRYNEVTRQLRSEPLRILMMSHNMDFEGAPLTLHALAKFLKKTFGDYIKLILYASAEGPMVQRWKALDAEVVISKIVKHEYDVLYLNTLVTWYSMEGIDLNKALLWVHESDRESFFRIFPQMEHIMRDSRRSLFVTNKSMMKYSDLNRGHFHVAHNGIDIRTIDYKRLSYNRKEIRASLGISMNDFVAVTVGTVYEGKGHRELVNSVLMVLSQLSASERGRFHLIIVGVTGLLFDFEEELRKKVINSGFEGQFHFIRKSNDVQRYLEASDLAVFPSHFESFGLAIVEAMAVGLPVIATDTDGIPETVNGKENAYLIPVSDETALKDAILLLYNNAELRYALSRNGRRRAEELSVEASFAAHLDIFTNLFT